jgi:hypothetical protein
MPESQTPIFIQACSQVRRRDEKLEQDKGTENDLAGQLGTENTNAIDSSVHSAVQPGEIDTIDSGVCMHWNAKLKPDLGFGSTGLS